MDNFPENVLNPELYKKAKAEADKRYKRAGAYKSMFIVKKYQELGGKYKGKKTDNLSKWRSEDWVSVKDYLNGKKVECGSSTIGKNACRPLKKVNDKTPITLPELIKIHGKKKLLELVDKKLNDMSGRLNWKKGTFKPSK